MVGEGKGEMMSVVKKKFVCFIALTFKLLVGWGISDGNLTEQAMVTLFF